MSSIGCMVVDDEAPARAVLTRLLEEHCPEVRVVGDASSVESARDGLKRWSPDLVFLDISMPVQDGFELLTESDERSFEVIFVTAYGHHAIRALRSSAVDYLLKPVVAEELQAAVKSAVRRLTAPTNALNRIQALIRHVQENARTQLAIPDPSGVTVVDIADIVRFQAAGSSTLVALVDGRNLMASRPLKGFEELVGSDTFVRVHSSHLVNLRHVDRYSRASGGQVFLRDGSVVDVARRRRNELLERLERL